MRRQHVLKHRCSSILVWAEASLVRTARCLPPLFGSLAIGTRHKETDQEKLRQLLSVNGVDWSNDDDDNGTNDNDDKR